MVNKRQDNNNKQHRNDETELKAHSFDFKATNKSKIVIQ